MAATRTSPTPHSPSSSPRLPSPPPFPESQIGPHSPNPAISGDAMSAAAAADPAPYEAAAMRRVRPGTKAADMSTGPPLVPLPEVRPFPRCSLHEGLADGFDPQLDSPFQLQEHLKALYHEATTDASAPDGRSVPITRAAAARLARPPERVERALWLYELGRFLVQRANGLIVGFFADAPPCGARHCPEMRASEWQYLCAVHDPPKSCCAIDYCCHTLDWAAATLTSPRHFPSRLTLGGGGNPNEASAGGGSSGQAASVRQLTNIFRRVYRMFAHAWSQHRDVFWALEAREGLYVFYKTVCDAYQLIPEENYTIPPEAEGLPPAHAAAAAPAAAAPSSTSNAAAAPPPAAATQEPQPPPPQMPAPPPGTGGPEPITRTGAMLPGAAAVERPAPAPSQPGTVAQDPPPAAAPPQPGPPPDAAATRRHRPTPSTGATVAPIVEGEEDDAADAASVATAVAPGSNEEERAAPRDAPAAAPDAEDTPAGSASGVEPSVPADEEEPDRRASVVASGSAAARPEAEESGDGGPRAAGAAVEDGADAETGGDGVSAGSGETPASPDGARKERLYLEDV